MYSAEVEALIEKAKLTLEEYGWQGWSCDGSANICREREEALYDLVTALEKSRD